MTRLKQDRRTKLYSKRPDLVHQRHLPHHVRPEVKRQPITPIPVHRNLKHLTDFQIEIRDLAKIAARFKTFLKKFVFFQQFPQDVILGGEPRRTILTGRSTGQGRADPQWPRHPRLGGTTSNSTRRQGTTLRPRRRQPRTAPRRSRTRTDARRRP